MRIVMVMFDSLNRHMLEPYGCRWTHTPNFRRLAERSLTFDTSYVCSMPCMPARRDLHTGRPNFLHSSWGPLEPFDDSMPRMLREHGVSTHLFSDHYHYWEPGGANYHSEYTTWQAFRGQEGDAWMGQVADEPAVPGALGHNAGVRRHEVQDRINRKFIRGEEDTPQSQTFRAGLDFIERHVAEDNWFVQIETFDPHEPFTSPRRYKDLFAEHYRRYRGPHWDWPCYRSVTESAEELEHLRYEYASLLAMCDARLGDVLDAFDRHGLWNDTMLIVWTDHGFLLGEQECLGKVWAPFYEPVARTPFFLWDPRVRVQGERRQALVQPAIDLPVTMLEAFGIEPTPRMLGRSLRPVIERDAPVREAAVFGIFGGQVNVTDGRFVLMQGPARADNQPLFDYTLMPTKMKERIEPGALREMTLAKPLAFSHGCPVLRIAAQWSLSEACQATVLYDLEEDPGQVQPCDLPVERDRMRLHLRRLMAACDAPAEQYERLGIASCTASC